MLLDIYDTLITDYRNQYNVINIDKQLTCKADDIQTK